MKPRVNVPLVVGVGVGLMVLGGVAAAGPWGAVAEVLRDAAWLAGLLIAAVGVFPLARVLRVGGLVRRLVASRRAWMRVSLCSVSLGFLGVGSVTLLATGVVAGPFGPIVAMLTLGGLAMLSVIATPGPVPGLTLGSQSADVLPMTTDAAARAEGERARAA